MLPASIQVGQLSSKGQPSPPGLIGRSRLHVDWVSILVVLLRCLKGDKVIRVGRAERSDTHKIPLADSEAVGEGLDSSLT